MIDRQFQVGDLVTRDGSDVQRVTEADDGYGCVTVECITAPASGWCKVGDVECNLSSRYQLIGAVIDDTPTRIAGVTAPPSR